MTPDPITPVPAPLTDIALVEAIAAVLPVETADPEMAGLTIVGWGTEPGSFEWGAPETLAERIVDAIRPALLADRERQAAELASAYAKFLEARAELAAARRQLHDALLWVPSEAQAILSKQWDEREVSSEPTPGETEEPRDCTATALDKKRRADRISWGDVADLTGISPSTFSRIGLDGGGVNTRSLVRLLVWLGDTDLKPYIRMEADDAH